MSNCLRTSVLPLIFPKCPSIWCIGFELWNNLYCPQIISSNTKSPTSLRRRFEKYLLHLWCNYSSYLCKQVTFVILLLLIFYPHKFRFYNGNTSWANQNEYFKQSKTEKLHFFSESGCVYWQRKITTKCFGKILSIHAARICHTWEQKQHAGKNPWINFFFPK